MEIQVEAAKIALLCGMISSVGIGIILYCSGRQKKPQKLRKKKNQKRR